MSDSPEVSALYTLYWCSYPLEAAAITGQTHCPNPIAWKQQNFETKKPVVCFSLWGRGRTKKCKWDKEELWGTGPFKQAMSSSPLETGLHLCSRSCLPHLYMIHHRNLEMQIKVSPPPPPPTICLVLEKHFREWVGGGVGRSHLLSSFRKLLPLLKKKKRPAMTARALYFRMSPKTQKMILAP